MFYLICESAAEKFNESGKRGSNSRPSAWEADALPTELLPLEENEGRLSKAAPTGKNY
jgi:hypothetical protein